MPPAIEANFDGIVGPTHNYAGLAWGNVASQENVGSISNPRAAALQGLAKMREVADLGVVQGFIPPQVRPDTRFLRELGFGGTDAQVLQRAWRDDPGLVVQASSAAAMWTANAATVCPSVDSGDGRCHLTPANLVAKAHRALEPRQTAAWLERIFPPGPCFAHHDPLPAHAELGDEGAANHLRLAPTHGAPGLQVFVYGRDNVDATARAPKKFPARQTRRASEALMRRHGVDRSRGLLLQQAPEVIDAGVFHNDVIAVSHRNLLFYHERAFADRAAAIEAIRARYPGDDLVLVEVSESDVPVADAVRSYLFNTQLVDLPSGGMAILAPIECDEIESARACIERLIEDDACPVREVRYFQLRESMRNGGGPACLRLRVVLTDEERAAIDPAFILTPARYERLVRWVRRHYRDRLRPRDLGDPQLIDECHAAFEALEELLAAG